MELQEQVMALVGALLRKRLRLAPKVTDKRVAPESELEFFSVGNSIDFSFQRSFLGGHFTS